MENYYEGTLTFILRNDIPVEIINDLYKLSHCSDQCEDYVKEDFEILQNTKWFKHKRFNYPQYQFTQYDFDNHRRYELFIQFYMKGYIDDNDDLGQDIYDALKSYIDESGYDIVNGYIGEVYDEDDTYNKAFYVNKDRLKEKMKKRKHLCNSKCHLYHKDRLCIHYKICHRAYLIGQKQR